MKRYGLYTKRFVLIASKPLKQKRPSCSRVNSEQGGVATWHEDIEGHKKRTHSRQG